LIAEILSDYRRLMAGILLNFVFEEMTAEMLQCRCLLKNVIISKDGWLFTN
jgi:hypothetical protein